MCTKSQTEDTDKGDTNDDYKHSNSNKSQTSSKFLKVTIPKNLSFRSHIEAEGKEPVGKTVLKYPSDNTNSIGIIRVLWSEDNIRIIIA